jgi:hypothetical protein
LEYFEILESLSSRTGAERVHRRISLRRLPAEADSLLKKFNNSAISKIDNTLELNLTSIGCNNRHSSGLACLEKSSGGLNNTKSSAK